MSAIEIDPTFVLKYLNDLGYRNITAEQLKEFIRDLKKLIKYDKSKEQLPHHKENIQKHYVYMKETESSRAKRSHSTNTITTDHTENRLIQPHTRSTEHSKSTPALDKTTNPDTNRTSGEATTLSENVNHVARSRTRIPDQKDVMWIRPKSTSRSKKSDPVSLYQSYQHDWNRFKNQIPIDNKHQDLRWNIRKKTMG